MANAEARASDVYEVHRVSPGFLRRLVRLGSVLFVNVLSMGSGPANPGGDVVSVVDRRTGREVLRLVDEMGDDGMGTTSHLESDLASLPSEEFAGKWLA